jgi:hypothetical protein
LSLLQAISTPKSRFPDAVDTLADNITVSAGIKRFDRAAISSDEAGSGRFGSVHAVTRSMTPAESASRKRSGGMKLGMVKRGGTYVRLQAAVTVKLRQRNRKSKN